jgi:hypothetical protein
LACISTLETGLTALVAVGNITLLSSEDRLIKEAATNATSRLTGECGKEKKRKPVRRFKSLWMVYSKKFLFITFPFGNHSVGFCLSRISCSNLIYIEGSARQGYQHGYLPTLPPSAIFQLASSHGL